MTEYRLQRPGKVDLVFEGELLANVSSKDDSHQEFWTEIRIFHTQSNRYVTETRGMVRDESKQERITVAVANTAKEAIESLHRTRPGQAPFLTDLALEAIDEASEQDSAFLPVQQERI